MKYLKVKNNYIGIIEMNSFLNKLNGLMWKRKVINKSYLFKTNGIHTFFMFQNIDVILTDKNLKVIYTIENMKPWRLLLPKVNVYYTFELPIGTSKYFSVGEVLTLEEK